MNASKRAVLRVAGIVATVAALALGCAMAWPLLLRDARAILDFWAGE